MKLAGLKAGALCAAVLLLLPAVRAAEQRGADLDFYRQIYRTAVEAELKNRAPEFAAKRKKHKPSENLDLAYAAWILGEQSSQTRYRDLALKLYDEALEQKVDLDFHVSRPLSLLTLRLEKAGLLTGARREKAKRQAQERIAWFLDKRQMDEGYFDCNIALADTLAVDCLARVFASEPACRSAEIRRAVESLGKRILAVGDLNENSSNYSSIGLCFFLELAKLEGWLDAVGRSESFRNLFARLRDIVSPAGSVPEFGDGYFQHREPRLDYALLLEMGARLFGDGSFQRVARKVIPAETGLVKDDELERGFMLMELEPFAAKSESQPGISLVNYRRVPGSTVTTVPDKLILRTSADANAAMVMIDLYAQGSHSHEYKRPSLAFYEVDGVPLFHNLGRRGTRSGQCGNSFWIMDQPLAFPGYPQPNVWNTMTIPAHYCFPSGRTGEYQIGSSLIFRNFRTPALQFLRLDNLRLEGPKGTLLLDGFESAKSWHGNVAKFPKVQLTASPDHTQGQFSQQINWSIFGEQYCTRNLERQDARDSVFRLAEYDTVKLDYKYEGQPPHCELRSLFKHWIDFGDRPLHCEVARAEARQLGGDALGAVTFTSYVTPDSSLQRTLVLTREGALIVVDSFTAGPKAAGWAGGQLWQMYSLKERGEDWFASESDGVYALPNRATAERRMLVKYMKTPGVTIGSERVEPTTMHAPKADGSQRREFFTTYSKQRLSAGQNLVAAMVVLPVAADAAVQPLAKGIAFEDRKEQGIAITIAGLPATPKLTVTVAREGATVQR